MIVEEMKNSILLSAFKGNLSLRNINDTNVEKTLRNIAEEKEKITNIKLKEIDTIKNPPFEIPKEWKWVRWGDLSNSIQYGVNAGAKSSGNVKLVRISDIKDNEVIWEDVPYSEMKEEGIEQYILNEGDILFARTGGTVGKSVIVRNIPTDMPYVFAGYLIRSNYSSQVNYRYLKYFMESPLYWEQLKNGTIGSAQPNCNGQTLSKMMLPFPPIEEQERIVENIERVFEKLDETIPIEKELNDLKGNFPGMIRESILFNYLTGLKHSNKIPVNYYYKIDLPEGWKWEKFGNLTECRMGKTILSKELLAEGIPVYSATNTDSIFGYVESSDLILTPGDIVIPARGNSIGCATYITDKEATCTQTTIACYPNDKINSKFLYYCCYAFKKVWFKYTGSAIPQITITNINKNFVPLPSLEEQKRIVDKIEEILPLIKNIEEICE